jgi:hypothetical protein
MLKWIKNSKGRLGNKYKGVFITKDGYRSEVIINIPETRQNPKGIKRVYLGYSKSLKEAKAKRIAYILSLM